MGLAEFRQRRAGQLSGGMKQKLGLALALVNRPRILLLDEPTTGVDPATRQDFWRLIIPLLRGGRAWPCWSARPTWMRRCAAPASASCAAGRLIQEGTPTELRGQLAGRIVELAGTPQALLTAAAQADPGVENVQRFGNRSICACSRAGASGSRSGCAAPFRRGGAVEHLAGIEPQLEDVFIALAEGQA